MPIHRTQLDISRAKIKKLPKRGNDVPLFDHKVNVGHEIRELYNECIRLISYNPIGEREPPLVNTAYEKALLTELERLKHLKDDYSKTWKDYFHHYPHGDRLLFYHEQEADPFSLDWLSHPELQLSSEMQEAKRRYLKEAEEIRDNLHRLLATIKSKRRVYKRSVIHLSKLKVDGALSTLRA